MRRCAVAIAVLAAACGGKDEAAKAEEDGKAIAAKYLVERARDELPKIKEAIAGAKPGDAKYKCAARMAGIDEIRSVDAALAKELDQLCLYDLPVGMMRVATERAEAAREAKPDDKVLSDCYSAEFSFAHDELKAAGRGDDASKALIERFKKVCPDAKL